MSVWVLREHWHRCFPRMSGGHRISSVFSGSPATVGRFPQARAGWIFAVRFVSDSPYFVFGGSTGFRGEPT